MKKLCAAFKKYWAITKITFANRIAYPVDFISGILFMIFIFSILFFLHRATMLVKPTSSIEYLTLTQTMWIIFLTTLFAGDTEHSVAKILNGEVLSGQIAYQLNRPYSFMIFYFAQEFGAKLPTLLFGGILAGLYIYFLVGLPQLSVFTMILGVLMICVGMVISFLLRFCIGLCAFWIGNTDPLRWIYLQVMVVAGGMAVPPAFFPGAIRKIILALPFSNVVYGAARIMVGCQPSDLLFYVEMQLFWLVMMVFIARFIFKRGVKNVTICGG